MKLKLIVLLLLTLPLVAQWPLVQIQDTVYNPGGGFFEGTMEWELTTACQQPDGTPVVARPESRTIRSGALDISLQPNTSCNPADTSYTVVYIDRQGRTWTKHWTVPTGGPYRIADVEASDVPEPSMTVQPQQIGRGGANIGDPMCFNDPGVWGPGTCGGGAGGGGNPSQPFSLAASVDAVHNCGTLNVLGMVLGADDVAFEPDTFQPLDSNTARFTFAAAETGRWVINCGATGESGNYTQNFTNETTVTVQHNRNTLNVILQVFNGSGLEFEPESTRVVDVNTVELTFATQETGTVVVNGG